MKWNKNLEILLDISREAGKAILEIYHSEDFEVSSKVDQSPLTIADQKANAIICDALKVHFPDIPIISEENEELPFSERRHFDYFWLVDPLDGTKEFINRNGDFTVNIALVKGREVVGGIVYIPVTDELFYAYENEGAWHQSKSITSALRANQFKETEKALRVVCSKSHLNEETQSFIDQLKEPELVSRGSSLKFLLLASGHAEIYPRLAPTMEWDTAAAQIILEESGGSVVNAKTGKKLTYNKEILRNPHFIAYGNKQ